MAYVVRTKDNPGDVGRAADQQQSVDNDIYFNSVGPEAMGFVPAAAFGCGIVRQWVKLTGMVDNAVTEFATITTTNEAGSADAGVYYAIFEGFCTHGTGPTGETSVMGVNAGFVRAINESGAAGNTSAWNESAKTTAAASTAGTKTLGNFPLTNAETSEYVISLRVQVDCQGGTITTGSIYGLVTVYYAGFTTPPVVTSIG